MKGKYLVGWADQNDLFSNHVHEAVILFNSKTAAQQFCDEENAKHTTSNAEFNLKLIYEYVPIVEA